MNVKVRMIVARRPLKGVRAMSRDRFSWMIGAREATEVLAKPEREQEREAAIWNVSAGRN